MTTVTVDRSLLQNITYPQVDPISKNPRCELGTRGVTGEWPNAAIPYGVGPLVIVQIGARVHRHNGTLSRIASIVYCNFQDIMNPSKYRVALDTSDQGHEKLRPYVGNIDATFVGANYDEADSFPYEAVVAPLGSALSALEIGRQCNYGPIFSLTAHWTNLFTGQGTQTRMGVGNDRQSVTDYFVPPGGKPGCFIKSVAWWWERNGVRSVHHVTYVDNLAPLLIPIVPGLCCGTQGTHVYPTGSWQAFKCVTYAEYVKGIGNGGKCKDVLQSYCRENMDQEECKVYCAEASVNCESVLETWCSNRGTPTELLNDPVTAQLCGCFLPQSFYVTFFESLKSALGNSTGLPDYKHCFFPQCADPASNKFLQSAKPPRTLTQCPNINNCINKTTFDNSGRISGDVVVSNNNECSFTQTTNPNQASASGETATITPDTVRDASTATLSEENSEENDATTTPEESSGALPWWVWLLIGLVGFALIIGLVFFLVRKKNPASTSTAPAPAPAPTQKNTPVLPQQQQQQPQTATISGQTLPL